MFLERGGWVWAEGEFESRNKFMQRKLLKKIVQRKPWGKNEKVLCNNNQVLHKLLLINNNTQWEKITYPWKLPNHPPHHKKMVFPLNKHRSGDVVIFLSLYWISFSHFDCPGLHFFSLAAVVIVFLYHEGRVLDGMFLEWSCTPPAADWHRFLYSPGFLPVFPAHRALRVFLCFVKPVSMELVWLDVTKATTTQPLTVI